MCPNICIEFTLSALSRKLTCSNCCSPDAWLLVKLMCSA